MPREKRVLRECQAIDFRVPLSRLKQFDADYEEIENIDPFESPEAAEREEELSRIFWKKYGMWEV
jgi:hypothetical protein